MKHNFNTEHTPVQVYRDLVGSLHHVIYSMESGTMDKNEGLACLKLLRKSLDQLQIFLVKNSWEGAEEIDQRAADSFAAGTDEYRRLGFNLVPYTDYIQPGLRHPPRPAREVFGEDEEETPHTD